MLKKKLHSLVASGNISNKSNFEIIYDSSASQILGGKLGTCGKLATCVTYTGDCPTLVTCGSFTDCSRYNVAPN